MASRTIVVCLLAMAVLPALGAEGRASVRGKVTPLQKVIQMLQGMLAKGKSEKHAEEVEFAKFHQWCDSSRAALEKSIEEGAAQIVQLKADIAKAEADAESLAEEIKALEAGLAQMKADLEAATAVQE